MINIVVASHNKGKVHEFNHLLHLENVKLLTLDEVGQAKLVVDETAPTYEGNALLKAKTIGDITHHLTISDDSGIEVDALGGKPGVHSARFIKGSDKDRCIHMLKELEGKENRNAKFVSVIVLYDPAKNMHHTFRGEVHGIIATEMMGGDGFGYDPIFVPAGQHRTMAELGNDIKNTISHRAKAAEGLRNWLTENLK